MFPYEAGATQLWDPRQREGKEQEQGTKLLHLLCPSEYPPAAEFSSSESEVVMLQGFQNGLCLRWSWCPAWSVRGRKITNKAAQLRRENQASSSQKSWSPFNFVRTRCKTNVLCYKEMEIVSRQPYWFSAASANLSLSTWQEEGVWRKTGPGSVCKTFSSVKKLPGL